MQNLGFYLKYSEEKNNYRHALNEESPRNRRLDIDTSGAGKWELLQSQITKNFFLISLVMKDYVYLTRRF